MVVPSSAADAPAKLSRWSVGVKLASVVGAVIAVVAVVVTVGLTELQHQQLVSSKRMASEMVTTLTADATSAPIAFGDAEGLTEQLEALMKNPEVLSVQVWSRGEGAPTLLGKRSRSEASDPAPKFAGFDVVTEQHDDRLRVIRPVKAATKATPIGAIVAEFSLAAENAEAARSRFRIATGAAITAALLAIGVLLAARIVVVIPLGKLMSAAADLAAGRFHRVPLESGDEVGLLARSFERMADAIAEREARILAEEKARIARELEIAASIQLGLLPKSVAHPDLDIVGRMVPADEVGGDFYDVLYDPERRVTWLTVGDVSGHGIDAGIVMLLTQSAFSTAHAVPGDMSADAALRLVNRVLHAQLERLASNKYVTSLLALYQGEGRFEIAGAHPPPLVFRAATRRATFTSVEGIWLGILPAIDKFTAVRLDLEPGDILCFYTDGITEAVGSDGTMLDEERFAGLLEKAATSRESLADISDTILSDVKAYSPTATDDRTLVLVRRNTAPTLNHS